MHGHVNVKKNVRIYIAEGAEKGKEERRS
jgi:hypothetical protein